MDFNWVGRNAGDARVLHDGSDLVSYSTYRGWEMDELSDEQFMLQVCHLTIKLYPRIFYSRFLTASITAKFKRRRETATTKTV